MLNSTEHEIQTAHNKCFNVKNCWHFNITSQNKFHAKAEHEEHFITSALPKVSGAVGAIWPQVNVLSKISRLSSSELYLYISSTGCPEVPNTLKTHKDKHIWIKTTVKFLYFGTSEIFIVIYLKFKQWGQTLGYFVKNNANGIANSEDPDQTAPRGRL